MVQTAESSIDSVSEKIAAHYPDGVAQVRRAYELVLGVDAAAARGGVEAADLLTMLRLDPPALGAHSSELLQSLGLDEAQIAQLKAQAVVA